MAGPNAVERSAAAAVGSRSPAPGGGASHGQAPGARRRDAGEAGGRTNVVTKEERIILAGDGTSALSTLGQKRWVPPVTETPKL